MRVVVVATRGTAVDFNYGRLILSEKWDKAVTNLESKVVEEEVSNFACVL
jgi:hypothetical protein